MTDDNNNDDNEIWMELWDAWDVTMRMIKLRAQQEGDMNIYFVKGVQVFIYVVLIDNSEDENRKSRVPLCCTRSLIIRSNPCDDLQPWLNCPMLSPDRNDLSSAWSTVPNCHNVASDACLIAPCLMRGKFVSHASSEWIQVRVVQRMCLSRKGHQVQW